MKKRIVSILMASGLIVASLAPAKPAQMAAKVSIFPKSITLYKGTTADLTVNGTKKKVTWTTSNKKIATVNKKGTVTAKSVGKATITAKVAKKSLKCKVTVVNKLSNYWTTDSGIAESLRNYVEKVTDEKSSDYIPIKDRIAVFDMDGTLMCETYPTYFDNTFFYNYVRSQGSGLSADVKEMADKLATQAGPGAPEGVTMGGLASVFAKAFAGFTVEQFMDLATDFASQSPVSFTSTEKVKYSDMFYQPMIELIQYLDENDFTIYVVSGTERYTSRAMIAASALGGYVSPSHVIGSEFEVKVKGHEDVAADIDYEYLPGDQLVFTGNFVRKNLNASKTVLISQEIGQKPVLAFGNSGSDDSMLNYTIDNNQYAAEAYMIVRDDEVREWNPQDWSTNYNKYSAMGYNVVSMKNDFAQIYPDGVVKAATQLPATPAAA